MRGNSLDASRRAYLGLVRGTINAASDKPKMQTVDVRGMQDELFTGVERFQSYGHFSVPLPPDKQGGKAAEVILGFVNGNRSHPVALFVEDRRYRPTGHAPGDSGICHYKGAKAYFGENGYVHDAGNDKQPATWTIGNATLTVSDGKIIANVGDMLVQITASRIDLGGTGGSPVMTQAGASSKVFAVV